MKKSIKILISLVVLFVISLALLAGIYLKVLPGAVSNKHMISLVQRSLHKAAGLDLTVKNPVLKTALSPDVSFSVDELSLLKKKETLLSVKKFDAAISFEEIFQKRIVVDRLGADYIFADLNKLSELSFSGSKKEKKKNGWFVDLFDSLLYVKECIIIFDPAEDMKIRIAGKDLAITDTRNPKFVHFKLAVYVEKNKEKFFMTIADKNRVYTKNRKLHIDDVELSINKSKVLINSTLAQGKKFDVKVHSKNFNIQNIVGLLSSNLIIGNGEELMSLFDDIKGSFDFYVNLSNDGIKGRVDLQDLALKVIMVNNIPIFLTQGYLDIQDDTVFVKDFKGYYGKNKKNTIEFAGTIKDYMKSFDTDIKAKTLATKEFTNDYLTKMVGYPIELVGEAPTLIPIKMKNNKIDLSVMFKLEHGEDILVGGSSLSPVNYDRAFKADLGLVGTNLEIKTIDYYIASVIDRNSKIKPILRVFGNMDVATLNIKNLGFEIPKPLPSEFLNVLIGQKVFKSGTIAGYLQMVNTGKYPVLDGHLAMNKVRVPSQRLFINDGQLKTNSKTVHLNIFGKYKKSDYKFTGDIANAMILPVVVKDIHLTVDNIDIERILKSFNSQNPNEITAQTNAAEMFASTEENEAKSDDEVTFNTGLIVIERCILEVVKGAYKQINFGNVKANMTLDKNGILQIHSNRFDIAEGISSLKVLCDLKKHEYSIKLGIKDVNSDTMATSLLALPREISGKASGLIMLNTDDSLKLNGLIKFAIKNGTIGKIGLVEYALKFASLFRNPMAMISPATLVDLVNVPEGNFDKINGDLELKDNVVEKIMIKSSAPQLSSFIVGRFDLETRDATLRIYTKFSNRNKGVAGFLRNFSLNSLANRVPLSSRNDSNYYAAELALLPPIDADEKDCQVFLTKVDGDVEKNNFLSSLKRIK